MGSRHHLLFTQRRLLHIDIAILFQKRIQRIGLFSPIRSLDGRKRHSLFQ